MKRLTKLDTGEIVDPRETPEMYNLETLRDPKQWSNADVRAEYSRLRKLALQRLKVFAKHELGRKSMTYQRNVDKYKPLKGMTIGQTKLLLHDLARFIGAERGTYSGFMRARNQAIETLQERGYEFINASNFDSFTEFMEYWRSTENRAYGSLVALDVYEAAIRRDIPADAVQQKFEQFLADRAKQIDKKQNADKVTGKALVSKFEKFLD